MLTLIYLNSWHISCMVEVKQLIDELNEKIVVFLYHIWHDIWNCLLCNVKCSCGICMKISITLCRYVYRGLCLRLYPMSNFLNHVYFLSYSPRGRWWCLLISVNREITSLSKVACFRPSKPCLGGSNLMTLDKEMLYCPCGCLFLNNIFNNIGSFHFLAMPPILWFCVLLYPVFFFWRLCPILESLFRVYFR